MINQGPLPLTVHDTFSIKTAPIEHNLCGTLTIIAFWEDAPLSGGEPVTYSIANQQFTAESIDKDLVASQGTFKLVVELTDYRKADFPGASSKTAEGELNFGNGCFEPEEFLATVQTNMESDKFSGTTRIFTLNPFTIVPVECKITYACTNVVQEGNAQSSIGCSDLIGDLNVDRQLAFTATRENYINSDYEPGLYTVTLTGTAVKSGLQHSVTFTIRLDDPCDPPQSITSPGIASPYEYILTDQDAADKTHPDFLVEPDFCEVVYTYSITEFTDSNG